MLNLPANKAKVNDSLTFCCVRDTVAGMQHSQRQLLRTVRNVRRKMGMSIRQVARRVGCSASWLSRFETGQMAMPQAERILALCRALHREAEGQLWLEMAGRLPPERKRLNDAERLLNEARQSAPSGLLDRIDEFLLTGETT